jgi:hypothetical protein
MIKKLSYGTEYYNEAGQKHRLDGPALEWSDGDQEWFRHDRRHRLDGPATIWNLTPPIKEWWINGFRVNEQIQEWANERDIDLNNLSDIDKAAIALEWGNYNGQ